jgi:hypothetical protein
VTLPGSTCLLNSFAPSSHPWQFYNLHVPSGVTLQGVVGSKLLQGPGGRQSLANIHGATGISNTVVTVGNNYATIEFQKSRIGGFYSLQAMVVGSPAVTLSTAAQAANFAVGDYVAIYQYTSGDVATPSQRSTVPTSLRSFASATVRTESGRETRFKIVRSVLGSTPRTSQ